MVYKVLWHNMQPIKPGTPGRTPSLFDKCTGFFYMHYTTHETNGFTSHPKEEAIMVTCLWCLVLEKKVPVLFCDTIWRTYVRVRAQASRQVAQFGVGLWCLFVYLLLLFVCLLLLLLLLFFGGGKVIILPFPCDIISIFLVYVKSRRMKIRIPGVYGKLAQFEPKFSSRHATSVFCLKEMEIMCLTLRTHLNNL